MARNIDIGTQKQNFYKEAYYKEDLSRVLWHEKYYNETTKSNKLRDLSEDQKQETRLKKLHEGVPKFPKGKVIPEITFPKKPITRKDELEEEKRYMDSRPDDLCDMYEVDPEVKEQLYDGFTKEEKGRYQYLRARKKIIPEEKYEFPITSAWELGWKQHESRFDFGAPAHGRSRIVRDTFYRPNKVFNPPIPWYMLKSNGL